MPCEHLIEETIQGKKRKSISNLFTCTCKVEAKILWNAIVLD